VRTTRRTAVTASGAAVLGLAGCTAREPASAPVRSSVPASTGTDAPVADPDQVAVDRALALTVSLLQLLETGSAGLDPAGRLAAMHSAHLGALQKATASTTSSTPSPTPARRTSAARLHRRELEAERELAGLARTAASGALARLLASMSAGIAAGIAAGSGRPGGGPS
jgi:hypothetical protein